MIVELHDFLTEANVEIGYQVVFILETGEYFSRDNPVSDAAYGPTWNGDTSHSPSKNSVFDKIESLVTPNHDHSGDAGDGGEFAVTNLSSGAAEAGKLATADGAGGITFEDPPESGGTPGGADTQVQFNDGGAFGGDAGLKFNKTSNTLTVPNITSESDLNISSAPGVDAGNGSEINIEAGDAQFIGGSGDGGGITLRAGLGGLAAGNGGTIGIVAGTTYEQADVPGGSVEIIGGDSHWGHGGDIYMEAGAGLEEDTGGDIILLPGDGGDGEPALAGRVLAGGDIDRVVITKQGVMSFEGDAHMDSTGASAGDVFTADGSGGSSFQPPTGGGDAADITFTPAVLNDWNGSADPGNVDGALNQLAARTTGLETAALPDHDHSGAGEGGSFDAANLGSGAATDGQVFTADGAGGGAFENLPTHPSEVEDAAYGAGWDGDTTHAPSQNAVYDKIETLVSDTAYGAGWDGVTDKAPSKNAVYDKIETLSSGSTDILRVQVFS